MGYRVFFVMCQRTLLSLFFVCHRRFFDLGRISFRQCRTSHRCNARIFGLQLPSCTRLHGWHGLALFGLSRDRRRLCVRKRRDGTDRLCGLYSGNALKLFADRLFQADARKAFVPNCPHPSPFWKLRMERDQGRCCILTCNTSGIRRSILRSYQIKILTQKGGGTVE